MKSNPSLLRKLDLSQNKIENTGVNHLCDVLKDSLNSCFIFCSLSLRYCCMTNFGCSALTSALKSNPPHLRELDLSGNQLGDSGVKNLSDLLMNPQFKLEKLHLNDCDLTDRSCSALATILGSDTNLKELNMNNNNLQDSGVKLLCTGLENIKCELEILRLSDCSITEEGYTALASALRSNPSHLIELDLTGNDPGQSGVKELNDLLQDPNYSLKTLSKFKIN
uniref:Uncharacterized protein n=1 Tax=Sinocyclocheilus grahami TaxID=75366 RepID=A0A672QY16_SINGR